MSRGLFDPLPQGPLDRVTTTLGTAFVAEARAILPRFVDDDTIAPAVLQAGIVKAHLLGALSAMSTLVADHAGPEDDELLVSGCADFLRDEVAKIRRALP